MKKAGSEGSLYSYGGDMLGVSDAPKGGKARQDEASAQYQQQLRALSNNQEHLYVVASNVKSFRTRHSALTRSPRALTF